MKAIIFSTIFVLITVTGCSLKQKKICVQNVAYQHGYQAAQKGEFLDGSSTYQGQTCQDFEAYSPTMYRQDFKAGYNKGKVEYCSEYNFGKWGKQEGASGNSNSPTNYPPQMKICLQDPQFKKLAEKTFQESFKEAYCEPQRFADLGTQQARDFKPLKIPSIGKTCSPKLADEMKSRMRKSYKEQMITNCTPTFWLLKGEKDAVAKLSKSVELEKVQKCASSKRDNLISQYSKAYNERKALLIEEEKLALEKKRHNEQMELAKIKQQQSYELEKERLAIAKGNYHPGHGGRPGKSFNGPQYFYYKGNRLYSKCRYNSKSRQARILVKNLGSRHVSLSGKWIIQYYNDQRRIVKTNEEREHLSLWKNERKEFKDRFAPFGARHCVARFQK